MRIILKHILKKQEAKCDCCTDLVQYSDELQADLQLCDGLSGRIKGGEFFDQMGDYQLPKGGPPAPGSRFAFVLFLDLRMRAVMS